MPAAVSPFLDLVRQAHEGRLKLPAFQRDWKWKTDQVILLYDSLRQGFPIGSFLFLKASKEINLAPRDFKGAAASAKNADPERLVLDGQQRITAGMELFYGTGNNRYFVDLAKLEALIQERKVSLDDLAAVQRFVEDLDVADDRYCVAKKIFDEPTQVLTQRHLLCTSLLVEEAELNRALFIYKKKFPEKEEFIQFVLLPHFRPSSKTQVPVTEIDDDIPVEGISRIFATLNTTGKLLTPFELVVALLFPKQIKLNDDVAEAKEKYPFYANVDAFGDIFLQTLALFAGKDTKKASLPKTITEVVYREHAETAFHYLNEAGKLLSTKAGIGLDVSNELLVYPVIFPPLAYVLSVLDKRKDKGSDRVRIERTVTRWFIGSVLSRRYQQSTHDRQLRDKVEILRWLDGEGDISAPAWLADTYIPNLRDKLPDGAPGKMLRGLMNLNNVRDPRSADQIGIRPGIVVTAKHHIFPTRYVYTLKGWTREDTNDVAPNIMFLSQETNIRWLNMDPRQQLTDAFAATTEAAVRERLRGHMIDDDCVEILLREDKTAQDFRDFLQARERAFIRALQDWGFNKPITTEGLDDPSSEE